MLSSTSLVCCLGMVSLTQRMIAYIQVGFVHAKVLNNVKANMCMHADELQLHFNSVNDQCVSCSALNSCWRSHSMFSDSKTVKEDCAMYTVSHIALPQECCIYCLHCEVKFGTVCCLCFFVRLDYTTLISSCAQTAVVFIDARSTFADLNDKTILTTGVQSANCCLTLE
jgi:hypothetical protein